MGAVAKAQCLGLPASHHTLAVVDAGLVAPVLPEVGALLVALD